MAGKREIKTTLALDGEQKFKKAMSDAASAIKELNSEQKLAEAQFEATGDAEEYTAEKTRILKNKIEEQRKAVAEAEKAIQHMKDSGVDPNSKAMLNWRTKVNQAKTSLTYMQTQLDRTETELSQQETALYNASTDANDYKEAMENAAKAVDFTATITAIDNVRNTIGTIITTAGRAAKSMINLERGAAGWADELATNAAVAELNVVDYQGWQYASQMIDTSVDSIRGAYKRLNKNMYEQSDEFLLSLNELNVAHKTLGGSARDTMEVFWDVVDAMGRIENTSRRDQLAMELFGKSYDELLPLINAGSEAFKNFIEEGKETAVSEENIKKLTDLDDTIVKLQATFDETKYSLLAELAPAFQAAAEAATEALGAFNEFLDSEEGQEALDGLKASISEMAEQFKDVDWRRQMMRVKGLITGIAKALSWFIDHSEAVIGAIGGLAAVWTGLTVSKDVLSVLQLLNTIKWAQITKAAAAGAASGAGAAGAGAGAGAAGAGAGAANATFKANAAMAASKFAETMLTVAPVALPATVIGGTALYNKKQLDDYAKEIAGMSESIQSAVEGSDDANLRALGDEAVRSAVALTDMGGDMAKITEELTALQNVDLNNILTEDTMKRYKRFLSPENDLDPGEVQQLLQDILADMDAFVNGAQTSGAETMKSLATGMEAEASLPEAAAETVASDTETSLDDIDSETIGYNVSAGLAEGINDGYELAVGAAEALGDAVAGRLSRVLEVRSPSKVMERIGNFVTLGFAKGIEDNVSAVERATGRMARATMGRAASSLPEAGAVAGRGGGMVHVTLVLDGRTVGETITPYVSETMSAEISRRR